MTTLDWPEKKNGKPVTTAVNQSILLAAASVASSKQPTLIQEKLDTVTNWRTEYTKVFETFVQLQSDSDPEIVIQMCKAGLDHAMKTFIMRNNDDGTNECNIEDYMIEFTKKSNSEQVMETITYNGGVNSTDKQDTFYVASPHGTDENPIWITGLDAEAQIKAWEKYGCMEPSAAKHAIRTINNGNNTNFWNNKIFCLLGITSEMGPTQHLLKLQGSHVIGVARQGSKLDNLIDWFQKYGTKDAILQIPKNGADMLKDFAKIAQWIVTETNKYKDKEIVLMPLAYMDGEANVRVTVAMDAIVQYVIQHAVNKDISLVYLTSPTTVYTIPNECVQDAKRRYDEQQLSSKVLSFASFGKWFKPKPSLQQLENDDDNNNNKSIVFNGIFSLQGPNYCLAKLMQQWRCMVCAYSDNNSGNKKVNVYAPHAPGTRTWSVTHSPAAAAALDGLQYFPPMVTFDVQPCSSLLTAIMLSQVNPEDMDKKEEAMKQQHPLDLFWDGSVHGGLWRTPFDLESMTTVTYITGKLFASGMKCPPEAMAPLSSSQSSSS